jgi:PAS domain S-box-containing protein
VYIGAVHESAVLQLTDEAGAGPVLPDLDIPEGERFRLLVEAVTDYAIYMLDPTGHVASWNAGAERAKGYTRAEIIGRHFSQFHTEEDRAKGLPQRALAIAQREGHFEGEGWRVRKDGSRMWAHVIIDPIVSPEGRLLGFAKITRDRTDRKAMQERLSRSEQQFRLLVQGVADYAIYMLDPEGHVTSWNAGARRIKGYADEEIIGQHFSRFYTPEDLAAGEPAHALDVARREGRYEREAQRVRKDGTRFWASVVLDAIADDTGELIGFAKITRDITERVDAQKKLEQTREAFYQAQKMDALGQLTGGIAHDFNNLLMAVLSSLEMMRKRLPEDPKLLQLLGNAVQGAERGAALTQRMLSFARRQDLDAAPVDVLLLVTNIQGLMERTLGPSVSIVVRADDHVRPAVADANQLELAILNLAVNARDAMPGGGTIAIDIRERSIESSDQNLAPGDYVCVSLSDKGEGMDANTLARATEPFFTTKGVGRGTGLGLSMVHGFAEQLSGGLRLKSEKNVGTTAELWLPAADALVRAVEARAEVSNPAPVDCQPLTVLAVDDDALVLMNTTEMLQEFGHTVIEAMNGKEALAMLAANPGIDVVVTDYAMPLMTGAQLVNEMASLWPGLPVVLATGYAELPTGETIKAIRLPKPFNEPDLARALAEAARSVSRLQ